MAQTTNDTILQEFSRNQKGDLCIHFSDPAYVRSDVIIFDRKDSSLHAVLHGASHFVGYADKDLARDLTAGKDIILSAPHYFSGRVNLKTKVSVC